MPSYSERKNQSHHASPETTSANSGGDSWVLDAHQEYGNSALLGMLVASVSTEDSGGAGPNHYESDDRASLEAKHDASVADLSIIMSENQMQNI
jgi:hypothetical protein